MRTSVPILGFVLGLIIVAGVCHGASSPKTVQVIGEGECADCQSKNIKPTHAFSGLGVTIDCKLANGELIRRGYGQLDKQGKFKVRLLIGEEGFKEECYAQLLGASGAPCSTHSGIESAKLVVVAAATTRGRGDEEVVSLMPSAKLKFSSEACTSAFLWPHYKYPPLPDHPWFHKPKLPPFHWPLPKKPCPPPFFKKPQLPPPSPAPVYENPPPTPALPPPAPVYEKPLPPPVPVYMKPLPPPVSVYKKPCPPLPMIPPIYKKKPLPPFPPIYKKPLPPLPPMYKKKPLPPFPPIYKKPLPPLPKLPPMYKKPCPPISIPKIPHKFLQHPKFKHLPSVPFVPPHP